MNTTTFTYKVIKEKNGYSIDCISFKPKKYRALVVTCCDYESEIVPNAIEATQCHLQDIVNVHPELIPIHKPKLLKDSNHFELTFDLITGKHIPI